MHMETQRDFISMVSHEFRTPLTAIEGGNYLLRHLLLRSAILPADATEKTTKWLDLQSSAIRTLKELVDQVLLLNRVEHGERSETPFVKTSPVSVLEEIATHFNGLLNTNRVTLQNEYPPGLEVEMDPALVKTAVENLVSNGLKYSWRERAVQLRVWVESDNWMIEVSDQGRGIPASDLSRLGRTFFRASNVGDVPGTGLGITIVNRIVKFHGGRLEVQSKQNVGTRFILYLPRAPVRDSTNQARHAFLPNGNTSH